MYGVFQRGYLVHHLLIDGQTSGGIDDDDVVVLGLCLTDGVVGNLDNVLVVGLGIDGNADALAYYVQLLDGSRTIDVAGYEQRILVVAGLQQVGKLTGEGGLTGTLQTRHEHNGGMSL